MDGTPASPAEVIPLWCARCAAELRPGAGDFYQVTIDAAADPTPPVLTGPETPEEIRREIERTLGLLASVSAREALDQVHRRLVLHLCGPCYRSWIEDPAGRRDAESSRAAGTGREPR